MNKISTKVFVAMSGGVDSSVAAALLQKEGYDVTGVYFKTYKPDGNREHCRREGMDAKKACEQLAIPFKVYDLQEEYKKYVFDYMIQEYKSGNTPNPDILCNKEIKFGIFAQKAFSDGAHFIATGHYAQIEHKSTTSALKKAVDTSKDQSYFLSQTPLNTLKKTLFPLGAFTKTEVRSLAKKFNLHTADKKDSQGICFIGHELNVKEFLKKYIPEKTGDVLNTKGDIIGTHYGSTFYTIGERHGFIINPKHKTTSMPKLFIIEKKFKANTIVVGTKEELTQKENSITTIKIKNLYWFNESPHANTEYSCRIRHLGKLYPCSFDNNSIYFKEAPYAPANGQFLALYDNDICLGGGVIDTS